MSEMVRPSKYRIRTSVHLTTDAFILDGLRKLGLSPAELFNNASLQAIKNLNTPDAELKAQLEKEIEDEEMQRNALECSIASKKSVLEGLKEKKILEEEQKKLHCLTCGWPLTAEELGFSGFEKGYCKNHKWEAVQKGLMEQREQKGQGQGKAEREGQK